MTFIPTDEDRAMCDDAGDYRASSNAYKRMLARHPNCQDPDHPGCKGCMEAEEEAEQDSEEEEFDLTPCANNYIVETAWRTEAGLIACVTRSKLTDKRCGYVAVPADSPLFNKGYYTALLDGHDPVSVSSFIDVHGGVTYSGPNKDDYPINTSESLWWFGFDCAHAGDDGPGGQSLSYCQDECESMALQLLALAKRIMPPTPNCEFTS